MFTFPLQVICGFYQSSLKKDVFVIIITDVKFTQEVSWIQQEWVILQ